MKSPEHERRQVVEYLAAEAADETVEHAEKIATERVFGNEYFVWDVHTDAARWWVVGPPTNLYSQGDFKSMDGVLSFHIGLMARVMAHEALKAPSKPEPRLEKTRRQWEQAAERGPDVGRRRAVVIVVTFEEVLASVCGGGSGKRVARGLAWVRWRLDPTASAAALPLEAA